MSSKSDTSQIVNSVLRNINGETGLTVHVNQLDTKHPYKYPFILPYRPDSYVILIFPVMEIESLHLILTQFESLWSLVPFNSHARFIFLVNGCFANINLVLERVNYKFWLKFKIANLVFMIPRCDLQGCDINEHRYEYVDTRNIDI
jgi:hypothetical protein